jgi:nicotinic acid mononucleotide adenylyltransferase
MNKRIEADYPHTQKETVLALLGKKPSVDNSPAMDILKEELGYIAQGKTTPDFLEVLSGPRLLATMGMIREIVSQNPTISTNTASPANIRSQLFKQFLVDLQKTTEAKVNVTPFLRSQRKALGLAGSISDLAELSATFACIEDWDLLGQDHLDLIQYPGTFNPFPHRGHLEVAQMAHTTENDPATRRVIVSTTILNPNKPEDAKNFPERLDNLQRGFLLESHASVIGLAGDYLNSAHRKQQWEIAAQLDSEQRLRLACGSDTFAKIVSRALEGAVDDQFILREGTVYVSDRKGIKNENLKKDLETAQTVFSTKVVILPEAQFALSGTLVRALPIPGRRPYSPNEFVRAAI